MDQDTRSNNQNDFLYNRIYQKSPTKKTLKINNITSPRAYPARADPASSSSSSGPNTNLRYFSSSGGKLNMISKLNNDEFKSRGLSSAPSGIGGGGLSIPTISSPLTSKPMSASSPNNTSFTPLSPDFTGHFTSTKTVSFGLATQQLFDTGTSYYNPQKDNDNDFNNTYNNTYTSEEDKTDLLIQSFEGSVISSVTNKSTLEGMTLQGAIEYLLQSHGEDEDEEYEKELQSSQSDNQSHDDNDDEDNIIEYKKETIDASRELTRMRKVLFIAPRHHLPRYRFLLRRNYYDMVVVANYPKKKFKELKLMKKENALVDPQHISRITLQGIIEPHETGFEDVVITLPQFLREKSIHDEISTKTIFKTML